jgi:hypothetical protein
MKTLPLWLLPFLLALLALATAGWIERVPGQPAPACVNADLDLRPLQIEPFPRRPD